MFSDAFVINSIIQLYQYSLRGNHKRSSWTISVGRCDNLLGVTNVKYGKSLRYNMVILHFTAFVFPRDVKALAIWFLINSFFWQINIGTVYAFQNEIDYFFNEAEKSWLFHPQISYCCVKFWNELIETDSTFTHSCVCWGRRRDASLSWKLNCRTTDDTVDCFWNDYYFNIKQQPSVHILIKIPNINSFKPSIDPLSRDIYVLIECENIKNFILVAWIYLTTQIFLCKKQLIFLINCW